MDRALRTHARGAAIIWVMVVLALALAAAAYTRMQRTAAKQPVPLSSSGVAQELGAESPAREAAAAREAQDMRKRLEAEKVRSDVAKAYSSIDDLLSRWRDAKSLASATPRVGLGGPLAQLQAMRREAEKLMLPGCLEPSKALLVDSMQLTIDGYLAFMADTKLGQYTAAEKELAATPKLQSFADAVTSCRVLSGPSK